MFVRAKTPWSLLASALRAGSRPLARGELSALGLDADALLAARVLERAPADAWRPAGCDGRCVEPALCFDEPGHEGEVVAVCTAEPPCCDAPRYFSLSELERFVVSTPRALALFAEANGLEPVVDPAAGRLRPLGRLRRRGRSVLVLHAQGPRAGLGDQCAGMLLRLGGDGAIALLGSGLRGGPTGPLEHPHVVALEWAPDGRGDLGLWRGLELLDPGYRARRKTTPDAVFDEVSLELGTEPGRRHWVRIDGREYDGFQQSDQKFLRLLVLAAARAGDLDADAGGWVPKWALHGDERDAELAELRAELGAYPAGGVSGEDRRAWVQSGRKREAGALRLALDPRRVWLDESLACFEFVTAGALAGGEGGGRARGAASREHGLLIARGLFLEARKRGAPLPDGGSEGGPVFAEVVAASVKSGARRRR